MSIDLKDYDYILPEESIATEPVEPRDHSKLMFIDRYTQTIEHYHFYDLPKILKSGDLLILNDTKVIPARLFGHKKPGGHKVEIFLLEEKEPGIWLTLVRPGKKIKKNDEIVFVPKKFECKIIDYSDKGERLVKFYYEGDFWDNLNKFGVTPLPPYIINARKHNLKVTADKLSPEFPQDREHYQTVYADIPGSVAAPTAGLHFTKNLLEQLKNIGVIFANITLHVSAGTFLPVKADKIENHKMHTEFYSIEQKTCEDIYKAISEKRRIIPIGTTSVRTLESAIIKTGFPIKPHSDKTSIFIYPGFEFKITNAMITNFHLPRSTLLLLVAAFAGRELILKAYQNAIKNKYRFYSYGDAMIIF